MSSGQVGRLWKAKRVPKTTTSIQVGRPIHVRAFCDCRLSDHVVMSVAGTGESAKTKPAELMVPDELREHVLYVEARSKGEADQARSVTAMHRLQCL
jgi:hypothetical protein